MSKARPSDNSADQQRAPAGCAGLLLVGPGRWRENEQTCERQQQTEGGYHAASSWITRSLPVHADSIDIHTTSLHTWFGVLLQRPHQQRADP